MMQMGLLHLNQTTDSDPKASNLQRASAAWASCFSYSRGSFSLDGFEKGVAIANEGTPLIGDSTCSVCGV